MNTSLAIGLAAALVPQIWRAPSQHLPMSAAERAVLLAEAARDTALRTADARRFSDLLTPDFIEINPFGRVLGQRDAVALVHQRGYRTEDVQTRIYHEAAVVSGRESLEGERPGGVRFLRVWIYEGDRWLILAYQATAIASETEAARQAAQQPSSVPRSAVGLEGADANDVAGGRESSTDAVTAVRGAETAYREAERLNDFTALSRYRAPEFMLIDRLGQQVQARSSLSRVDADKTGDFSVRVHGRIAVIVGSLTWIDRNAPSSTRLRYVTVWVLRDGRWQVVAEQRTPIA